MATRMVLIYDKCTTPGCNRTLHSISEGERGTCSSCWVSALKPETRKAMNRLIASAFNGASDAEKDAAVDDAFKKLDAEKTK